METRILAQTWSAEGYQRHAAFVPALGRELVSWLNPQRGERILDLGCGDGVLTDELRADGATVIGVDGSFGMAAAARTRGLTVVVMNGEALAFDRAFDAVFSNAAMHWMHGADAVVAGVRRALRPRGRFVAEFGGHGCVAAIHTAVRAVLTSRGVNLVSPWYFPTPDDYGAILERHGFTVDRIVLFPRPTPLPTGLRGWLETFGGKMLAALPEPDRPAAVNDIEALLKPALCDAQDRWTADYVRLRFSARTSG